MSTTVYRYGFTLIPGSFITVLLLLFMMALVVTDVEVPIEEDTPKITALFHITKPIDQFPKPVKPPEPTEIDTQPPKPFEADDPTPKVSTKAKLVYKQPQQKIGPASIGNSDPIPLYMAQPRFPDRALKRGISGYAIVSVTITTSGSVRNPVLVEESPQGYSFGKAALKAAEKLKYHPKVVDDIAVEVPNVEFKYSFAIEE